MKWLMTYKNGYEIYTLNHFDPIPYKLLFLYVNFS